MATRQVERLEWIFFILGTIASEGGKIQQKPLVIKAGILHRAKNPRLLCRPGQIPAFLAALEFLKKRGMVQEVTQGHRKFFCSENGLEVFIQSLTGVEKLLRTMQENLEQKISELIREEMEKVIEGLLPPEEV